MTLAHERDARAGRQTGRQAIRMALHAWLLRSHGLDNLGACMASRRQPQSRTAAASQPAACPRPHWLFTTLLLLWGALLAASAAAAKRPVSIAHPRPPPPPSTPHPVLPTLPFPERSAGARVQRVPGSLFCPLLQHGPLHPAGPLPGRLHGGCHIRGHRHAAVSVDSCIDAMRSADVDVFVTIAMPSINTTPSSLPRSPCKMHRWNQPGRGPHAAQHTFLTSATDP